MFMTDKVRIRLAAPLGLIERQAELLRYVLAHDAPQGDDGELRLRSVERLLQVALECVADVGNILIDTLMMRDAASYVDIVDILADERVLSPGTALGVRRVMALRRALMQQFVEDEVCAEVWECAERWPDLQGFCGEVRAFSQREQ